MDGKVRLMELKILDELPENAKKYIFAIEDFIGAKISSVSQQAQREKTQY